MNDQYIGGNLYIIHVLQTKHLISKLLFSYARAMEVAVNMPVISIA